MNNVLGVGYTVLAFTSTLLINTIRNRYTLQGMQYTVTAAKGTGTLLVNVIQSKYTLGGIGTAAGYGGYQYLATQNGTAEVANRAFTDACAAYNATSTTLG